MNESKLNLINTDSENFRRLYDDRFNKLEQTIKTNSMKKENGRTNNIIYWIVTILLVLGMASGGIAQLMRAKPNVEGTIHLGYPVYIMTILGIWKLLGVVVLLLPKFRLLKEWAYAGFFFDLSAAVVSHMVSGDGLNGWLAPLVFTVLTVVSWWTRPENRRLPWTNPIN